MHPRRIPVGGLHPNLAQTKCHRKRFSPVCSHTSRGFFFFFFTPHKRKKTTTTDNPPLCCSCRGVDRAASALALTFRLCNNFNRGIHSECSSCQLDHSGQMVNHKLHPGSDKVPILKEASKQTDNASRAGPAIQTLHPTR